MQAFAIIKKRQNNDKCRFECKELIDKDVCDKGSIWYSSNCECECDKACNVGEYLDCKNCQCKKKLVDKLVIECTENIDEAKIAEITSMKLHSTDLHSAGHKNVCVCSYKICDILAVIALAIMELGLTLLILVGT